jgi:hypothetical protein
MIFAFDAARLPMPGCRWLSRRHAVDFAAPLRRSYYFHFAAIADATIFDAAAFAFCRYYFAPMPFFAMLSLLCRCFTRGAASPYAMRGQRDADTIDADITPCRDDAAFSLPCRHYFRRFCCFRRMPG